MESKSGPRGHDATSLTKTPGRFAIYQAILTLGKLFTLTQGRRHSFKSGGTNITVSEASRKFFGDCTPTYAILGVQQLQREAYGEPIGQRCYLILLVVLVH